MTSVLASALIVTFAVAIGFATRHGRESSKLAAGLALAALILQWPILRLVGYYVSRAADGNADRDQLFVVGSDGSHLRQLTHDAAFHDTPAWSPDGRWIATALVGPSQTETLELVSADAISSRRLEFAGPVAEPDWQAADRLALTVSNGPKRGIAVAGTDGSLLASRRIALLTDIAAWSPDAGQLAFIRGCPCSHDAVAHRNELAVTSVNGSDQRVLAENTTTFSLAWSPQGTSILYIKGGALWRVSSRTGTARRLAEGLAPDATTAWSPDGRSIAFDARSAGKSSIYIIPASGGRPRRLTSSSDAQAPAWSPTGATIAFIDGDRIRTIHPDGTGAHTLVGLPDQAISGLSWSPDGRSLAFAAGRPAPQD